MTGPMWKPSRTARKLKEKATRLKRKTYERDNKADVRKRDRSCRFPLCGCRRLGIRLEVSHETAHKGAGGDPKMQRSAARDMLYLCVHRHQHGRVSRHAGTLKSRYLTPARYDGPIEWLVDTAALDSLKAAIGSWRMLARESAPGVLEPLTDWQRTTLEKLATMQF